MDGGCYIAVFELERDRRLRIGKLGTFDFPAGVYCYIGSALRSRDARLARHARRRKPLRWHVDYLSTRACMLGAVLVPPDWVGDGRTGRVECRLAAALERFAHRHPAGFGASDCRCGGHLLHSPASPCGELDARGA